jgi:hypothetical protein
MKVVFDIYTSAFSQCLQLTNLMLVPEGHHEAAGLCHSDTDYLQNLVASISTRLAEAIEKAGQTTNYQSVHLLYQTEETESSRPAMKSRRNDRMICLVIKGCKCLLECDV